MSILINKLNESSSKAVHLSIYCHIDDAFDSDRSLLSKIKRRTGKDATMLVELEDLITDFKVLGYSYRLSSFEDLIKDPYDEEEQVSVAKLVVRDTNQKISVIECYVGYEERRVRFAVMTFEDIVDLNHMMFDKGLIDDGKTFFVR